jgi:hypothetical protein
VKSNHHDLTPLFYNVSQMRKEENYRRKKISKRRKEGRTSLWELRKKCSLFFLNPIYNKKASQLVDVFSL